MERLSRATDRLGLSALPGRSVVVIASVALVNGIVWAAAGIVLRFHPVLAPTALLCYTLGLRHGLDADHISAIDLVTRRLIAEGRRPATVGTFFSLGHATIVIVTCIAVAATSGALRDRFDGFARVGGVIGTAVSAAVLLLLCLGNGWVLWRLVVRLRAVLARRRLTLHQAAADDNDNDDDEEEAQAATMPRGFGLVARFTSFLYKSIDRPWKMFPLGLVFGLGFDTSSEVALLGIASVHAAEGTSIWLILVFPVLFTAGMCLVDSADGALMMGLYTSKAFARDDLAILYYSIVLTSLTIAVSFFIGVIQVLSLAQNVAHPQGPFWDGVTAVTDRFDAIGGGICALFVVVGLASVIAYRPWRKHIDRRQRGLSATAEESLPETDGRPSPSQEVLSQGLGERGG